MDQAANALIQQQTNLQDRLATQNAANAIAVQHGALSPEAANLQRLHGQAQVNQTKLASGTGGNPFIGALAGLDQFKTSAQQIQDAFEPVFKTLSDGFADSIGRAIAYTHNLGQALKEVAQSAVAQLISGLVKMGIQYIINATLGQALSAASTGASVAQAGIVAAAWSAPAALVSLASFGANGVAADVAIATTTALTKGLALIPKLASGTNYVPHDMMAHIHQGERVIPAADNTALVTALGTRPNGSNAAQPIVIHNHGTSQVTAERMNDHIRVIVRDEAHRIVQNETPGIVAQHAPNVIATDIANPNSKTSKALSRNVTTSRVR